jgi:hypothetical protein
MSFVSKDGQPQQRNVTQSSDSQVICLPAVAKSARNCSVISPHCRVANQPIDLHTIKMGQPHCLNAPACAAVSLVALMPLLVGLFRLRQVILGSDLGLAWLTDPNGAEKRNERAQEWMEHVMMLVRLDDQFHNFYCCVTSAFDCCM